MVTTTSSCCCLDVAVVARCISRALAAELDTVWFKQKRVKGPHAKIYLRTLTAGGLAIVLRRAMVRMGQKATKWMRGMHDFCDPSGTQTLRWKDNIGLA